MNKKKINTSGIVYSTDPDFRQEEEAPAEETLSPKQQKLKVRLDTKQRAGKAVTLVEGFSGKKDDPEVIAKKCQRHAGVKFNLINISNRGTQVWPTGSVYTNLVNQYNVRFESIDGSPLNQQDVLGLYVSLSGDFKICSSELLNMWGGKKAYSLAQGQ